LIYDLVTPVRDVAEHDVMPAGLSDAEAAARLAADGFNEIARQRKRSALRIALDVLREPMFLFLISAGAIYLLLGETSEALLLSAFATTSVVITIVQEFRSERVLQALRDLTSPRALVIRGGVRRRIAGREVARGDILVVSEGDRIAADALLLRGAELAVDESLLTGESVPVRKVVADRGRDVVNLAKPGGDDTPFLFSGTLAVRGQGIAEVTATGSRSEIGKIGASLAKIETEPPRLKAETTRLVRLFASVGAAVCLLAVVVQLVTGHSPLQALLAGIALGMALLPEEFPLVLTVFTVMGAWRISQAHVLTRRASAIEALGEATVLCTDKTGTLTENRMAIAELRLLTGERFEVDGSSPTGAADAPLAFQELVSTGALASQPVPIDPMDAAFVTLDRHRQIGATGLRDHGVLERTHGVTPTLLAVTNVWRFDESAELTVAAKGAPEAIAALSLLTPEERNRLTESAEEMGRKGLRVLAVAKASVKSGVLTDTPHGYRFTILGLVGLADPLRENVKESVVQCSAAGIRVIMITGDYPATARAIARAAGIDASEVVSGCEIEQLDAEALRARVRQSSIFARITPRDKLRIIQALQANGEIAAMIGDGVNDAPTLKAAHIGIAMGGRGTDVAREAAALVLLNDDFASVVTAIRLGRRIFDNLRKAMGFVPAIHVPIAGLALFPIIFGLPPIIGPLHIAFLELIIDPVCSVVFESEPEDENVMKRPPRSASSALLSSDKIVWGIVQGTTAFIAIASLFVGALAYGLPADQARALAFGALIASTIALVLANRTFEASSIAALTRPIRCYGRWSLQQPGCLPLHYVGGRPGICSTLETFMGTTF
jgi:P-type Ca2+ transporter type 2C